ncbi:MAG: T9SS type A sorting domain-containing protein [Chitinophagaceae bacterium]|nr:T9SS type A sorting domain-containing protein [Chitinophagaceae bacterium]
MKTIFLTSKFLWITALFTIFFSTTSAAQVIPGYINRQATSVAGRAVLDPNNDGYTSSSASGFGAPSDVATSEIPFKIVQSYSVEPFGDLRRGPDQNYSDFVPDGSQDGFYTYYDGTNLLFRFRLGSIMPGSKGYSILIDTDGKFGATGTNADPNYQPATTGTNGNPGFEIEIVLETNSRIAIYNADGTSSPTLITSYTNWQDMSQVSLAATNDNGDPDFFMDFYIPFSALTAAPFNLTTSTPLRMIPTTVMSPQGAIGGPKSDIYGLSDDNYNNTNTQYQTFINAQPSVTITNLSSGGSGFGGMCTAPPIVNSPVSSGTVNISGTWVASSLSGAVTTATITVYKNGSSVGTIAGVTTGSTWTLNSVSVVDGDIITARAQGSGESMCLTSNSVPVQGCNTSNIPSATGLSISCISNRGIEGTFSGSNTVKIYFISSTLVTSTLAGPTANSPTFGYNGSNFYYNGVNYNGSQIPSACSGGAPDMNNGTYYVTTISSGSSCESAPVFTCFGLTSTATPVITQTSLYASNNSVSGTATSGATVYLWINGQQKATTTATGGNYSFTGLTFNLGDVVDVRAITSGNCMSDSVSRTVSCYTNPPIITADKNNQITAGQYITGTSSEPTGTTIRVYNSTGPTLVATTTVQAGGVWSTSTIPYSAIAGTSYYATAQNGTCTVSNNSGSVSAANQTSASRCGTITGPVSSGTTSVSGTLATAVANTTVNLYLDGELIGSTITGTTAWTVSSIPSTTIYSNGVLTIGVLESGSQEIACSASVIVTCSSSPVAPLFTPANTTIGPNQSVTYTVSNAVSGNFYAVSLATGASLGAGKWATSNGNLTLTTDPISSTGNYSIVIKATNLSGVTVCTTTSSAASINVTSTLPLTLLSLTARWESNDVLLNWETTDEVNTSLFVIERSANGRDFNSIGMLKAAGNSVNRSNYNYKDIQAGKGVHYYRLKMIDLDGNYTYSNIIVLRTVQVNEVKAWPNPFHNQLNIAYQSETNSIIQVQITDVTGKLLFKQYYTVNKGNNQLLVQQLQTFNSGIYFVEIIDIHTKVFRNLKLTKQ